MDKEKKEAGGETAGREKLAALIIEQAINSLSQARSLLEPDPTGAESATKEQRERSRDRFNYSMDEPPHLQ